ncbi:hypothetical protein HDEF_1094 [Candidatus Hamiltonella defensa 5AT (Acyrthosiphon pisum)]|uniref:Uncharacterized protein n=1 Tax=Hamiltonella defensa subsp. Acyrthosiphon pisum (strain 5AT) TaxID=572265 RepID=C4K5C4_HAMD5|nr:hypothetical protein HDEF_1094 [Candidatus Hamiltonella defensa 5AT (Acyrthosiphon pisum)]
MPFRAFSQKHKHKHKHEGGLILKLNELSMIDMPFLLPPSINPLK